MASLALGVVGAVVGGVVGGGVGASIGWMLGSALGTALDPQKIEGPKLTDLKLQGTSYGVAIPIIYGSMRIASCCVLWKTDLQPHEHTTGGKGGPAVTTTTYSASFSLLLGETFVGQPIDHIGRIWADNRLVYDAGVGGIAFTLYKGEADQGVDPTMEADLGTGNVPAYRGYAYVVFADLDLSDYFDRIPNFTFEVITKGANTGSIRRLEQNLDIGMTFGEGFTPNGKNPAITYWPWSGDNIRIKTIGYPSSSAEVAYYDFDRASLTITTPGPIHDDYPITFTAATSPACPGGSAPWAMYPVGIYVYADGSTQNLWVYPGFVIGTTDVGPAMFNAAVTVPDCGHPHSAGNILHDAGLPSGEYVGAAALSASGTKLFVFTAPSDPLTGAGVIDKWYEVIDGNLTRQGTVTPHLDIYRIGFGVSTSNTATYNCSSFEDNGKYCWSYYGSPPVPPIGGGYGTGGIVRYWIIDDALNFALCPYPGTYVYVADTEGGTRAVADPPDEGGGFVRGSVKVIKDGYAGVIGATNLAVFTRLVDNSDDVLLMDIVTDLSVRAGLTTDQIDVSELTDVVHGYMIANQADVWSAIAPLQTGYFFDAVESGALVKFPKRGKEPILTIPDEELAAHEDKSESPPVLTFARTKEVDLPRRITTTFFNQDDAYQNGSQVAQRLITASLMETSVQLPIALTPSGSKQIADRLLWSAWYERDTFTLYTARKYVYLEPTDTIIAHGRSLRITAREEQPNGVIKWQGVQSIGAVFTQGASGVSGGAAPPPPIVIPQATTLALLDLPLINDGDAANGIYVAMAGAPGWRGATLYSSPDNVNYSMVYSERVAAVMGTTSTVLGAFYGGNTFDESNSVTVVLSSGEISGTTSDAMLNNANMMLIGSEIVQVRNCDLIAANTYLLTGFLRGRRGTEWAMDRHASGERFALLPLSNPAAPFSELGALRYYKAVTVGKTMGETSSTTFTNTGMALAPYSPVNLGGGVDGSGNVTLNWQRRTRISGAWVDRVDVPLSESAESYIVQIWNADYSLCARIITATSPTTVYSAADQTTDFGATQEHVYFSVQQLGSFGAGRQGLGVAGGSGASDGDPLTPIEPYGAIVNPAPSDGIFLGDMTFDGALHPCAATGEGWYYAKFTIPSGVDGMTSAISYSEYVGFQTAWYVTWRQTPGDISGGADAIGNSGNISVSFGSSVHAGEVWYMNFFLIDEAGYPLPGLSPSDNRMFQITPGVPT